MVKRKYSGGELLQVFGERSAPMALSEIAELAGLPRVTARRIRFALAHGGYVSSDGKLFTATPHVLTLAGSYLHSNQLVAVLQPALDDIATSALEISSRAVLDGDDVVFVARGPHFRSIAVPVNRYDGAVAAAINIGAHVDRISTDAMQKRFLPLLRDQADHVMAKLL